MAIEFECPGCQSRIRTPDEAAGKKARCPNCKQIAQVPLSSSSSLSGFTSSSGGMSNTGPGLSAPLAPFHSFEPGGSKSSPAPAPWLPPANAFAPQGPPLTPTGQPLANSSNPFGDYAPGSGGLHSGPLNPYASPGHYDSSFAGQPLTKDEVRQKLLGPAIGMTLGAVINVGLIAFSFGAMLLDDNFNRDLQQNGNALETTFAYLFLTLFMLVCALPGILTLIGAYAMYRGRGVLAAWVGSIAAVLPCNPCFFISAGFAIWGMVVLADSRVQQGMK